MKTIRLTMAQALVRFLDNQYINIDGQENKFIQGVFGIFGHGNVVGLGEALQEANHGLKFYQGHNEQGMAHTAIGYAKQKKRREIFAVTSSVGPGALNMVTAAGTATANRIPVLLLPGDTFATRQPDPVLQQVEHSHNLSMTANDSFKAVSVYWDRITRPEQLISTLIHAMRVLTDPAKTGAVTLCLPQDVEGEAYDYPEEFFEKRIHYVERTPLTQTALTRLVDIISTKKKPIIICGGGVRYSDAGKELAEFAQKFNIPFGETQAGKSAVVWDHPMNLGGIGVTGTYAANIIAKDADCVIGVGTRFTDFTTSSKHAFGHPGVEFVTININDFDAYKMNATPFVADAKVALKDLQVELEKRNYMTVYEIEIIDAKTIWNKEVDKLFQIELEEGLSQTRVLGELSECLLEEDAIVVGASGSLPGDLQRVWRPRETDTYHMEYGFSCMGYEIAATLGAKLAEPDKEVYTFLGDGSYIMLHSELFTSIQENKKINIILLDNNGYQCIHNLQRAQGIPSFANEFRKRESKTGQLTGEYLPVDFAKNAESYGAKGFTVHTIEELRQAFKEAKESPASTLIDIKVLPGTMTGGYESWWRVGVPEVSEKETVQKAYDEMEKTIQKARKF